ncbi:MAG TPA: hypothetical protein EYQ27_02065, partial [Gemmatimonadetes bacterium]|nr:hypothetical protein [Gemmatimonadota bacterium]
MASARIALQARLAALERVIPEDLLQNRTLRDREHNESAKLIRNGLMVVGVAALEDFIRARLDELTTFIPTLGRPFGDLPDAMRRAATSGVLKSASGHLQRVWKASGEDLIAKAQGVALDVASTGGPGYTLSQYTFGHTSSNLSSYLVKDMGLSFHLSDPWGQIGEVARRVGLGSPSHAEAFDQSLRNRHAAAHDADASTQPTDLTAFVQHALGIAIGTDAVFSRAARLIANGSLPSKDNIAPTIAIRFIGEGADGFWREKPEAGRTYRRNTDLVTIRTAALARADR